MGTQLVPVGYHKEKNDCGCFKKWNAYIERQALCFSKCPHFLTFCNHIYKYTTEKTSMT